jgi:hypothetical protein
LEAWTIVGLEISRLGLHLGDGWSIVAISAGIAGITHVGPLFYDLPLDCLTESITTLVVLLLVTVAGVAAFAAALKMKARWSRLAGATLIISMLLVTTVLFKYQAAWGWATG